jgi:hypothetical protein
MVGYADFEAVSNISVLIDALRSLAERAVMARYTGKARK